MRRGTAAGDDSGLTYMLILDGGSRVFGQFLDIAQGQEPVHGFKGACALSHGIGHLVLERCEIDRVHHRLDIGQPAVDLGQLPPGWPRRAERPGGLAPASLRRQVPGPLPEPDQLHRQGVSALGTARPA